MGHLVSMDSNRLRRGGISLESRALCMPEAVAVLAPAWHRAEPAGPQDPVQPRSVGPATPATAVPVWETRSVAGDG